MRTGVVAHRELLSKSVPLPDASDQCVVEL